MLPETGDQMSCEMTTPGNHSESGICVLHLVWAPLGLEPFQNFLDSYRRHPAGVAHRLLIVFNGFASPSEAELHLRLLEGLEHSTLWLPQPVQDIAAYLRAAGACAERWLCFLNSYSVILSADWLRKMHGHMDGQTRLVGVSGSWESMDSSRRQWHRQHPLRGWTLHRLKEQWQRWRALFFLRRHFLPFPNPHLRTNAFLIERALLFSPGLADVRAKDKAHRFESGRAGLTARVRDAGFNACVVDREGRAWQWKDWPVSRTFRSGNQENLLVSDNRTRAYDQASPAERRALSRDCWGVEEPV